MAFRGCVILLFILLSGIVFADVTTVTTPSTTQISTSRAATETHTTVGQSSTNGTTTTTSPTNSTTEAPTPTHHNATTEAPTTIHHNATTEAPTTIHHNATTEAPTTTHHNATTGVPTTAHTNATTAPPTTPPVPNPTVGNYSVTHDVNSTACLLAKMGLQFSFTTSGNASRQTINLDPNVTKASGSCGIGGSNSSLVLKSDKITAQFVFTNVSDKFRLHSFVLSIDLGKGVIFTESNTNLSLWEASIGSSYMCRKEQNYNISDKLTLNTFELQVQPFSVQKNTFSTAHECSMDDTSLLIPIIVGAALAGLIFIVVIAYVIGRRKTYVGYQTL